MRDATPDEAAQIAAQDARTLGYRVNPCQSIPSRHTPHTAGDGRTYCTTCGEGLSDPGYAAADELLAEFGAPKSDEAVRTMLALAYGVGNLDGLREGRELAESQVTA